VDGARPREADRVCAIGALGYLIGGVLAGEIDVQRSIDNLRRK